jgi:hypothetical protein
MLIPASVAPFYRRGASSIVSNTTGGNVVMISAGTNVNGILIRTLNLNAQAGAFVVVSIGGNQVFQSYNFNTFFFSGPPFFVPPGLAVEQNGNSGGSVIMTWDLL